MLASGDFHMLAATKPSPLVPHALCLAWGYGAEGQGGHGGSLHLRTPRPVDALRGGLVALPHVASDTGQNQAGREEKAEVHAEVHDARNRTTQRQPPLWAHPADQDA